MLPGPIIRLMALPASVLADGIDWDVPLNGSQVGLRQGQRRKGHPASQGARGKVQKAGSETKSKGANSMTTPNGLIAYDKKYDDRSRSKVVPRPLIPVRNGCKRGQN